MLDRPKTFGAITWGRIVYAMGCFYLLISIIAGAILLFTTDSYCNYVTECNFLEKHPYAIIGLPLLCSGLTFGAPMIAFGLYVNTQIKIQRYRLDINSPA